MSSGATAEDVRAAMAAVLAAAGRAWPDLTAVATLASLAGDPRLQAPGRPVLGYPPAALAAVPGVSTSGRAAATVGTPSVAEAAALLGAGPCSRLVVPKHRAGTVTVALATAGPAPAAIEAAWDRRAGEPSADKTIRSSHDRSSDDRCRESWTGRRGGP